MYIQHNEFPSAMMVAQKINDPDLISQCMETCKDPITQKQMAFMLGRQRNSYESEDSDLNQIISQEKLSEHFKQIARDLD